MPSNESVGKKIVEALKKQAENMDVQTDEQLNSFTDSVASDSMSDDIFAPSAEDDIFAEPVKSAKTNNFFDDIEDL